MEAVKGIDVSVHQGKIDWNKVKKAGIKFVIIRAGYGQNNIDASFKENIKGALAAGLKVGAYWFSYAYTTAMAKKEAEYCLKAIKGYDISLPIFFDWEYDSEQYAKKNGANCTKDLITSMSVAFCNEIKKAGYIAGYYENPDYIANHIYQDKLKGFDFWLAHYTTKKSMACDIWQYSDKGKIDGIAGAVDMNYCYKDYGFTSENKTTNKNNTNSGNKTTNGNKTESKNKTKSEVYDMQTIKKGSQGRIVRVWQVIVSAKVDGNFGKDTEAKTITFQKTHGLAPDGIVGDKTWAAGLASLN